MLRLLALVVLPVLCMGGVLNLIEDGAQMVTQQQIINSFPRIQTSAPTALFSLLHWKNDINTKEISELLQIDAKTDKEGQQRGERFHWICGTVDGLMMYARIRDNASRLATVRHPHL